MICDTEKSEFLSVHNLVSKTCERTRALLVGVRNTGLVLRKVIGTALKVSALKYGLRGDYVHVPDRICEMESKKLYLTGLTHSIQ